MNSDLAHFFYIWAKEKTFRDEAKINILNSARSFICSGMFSSGQNDQNQIKIDKTNLQVSQLLSRCSYTYEAMYNFQKK